MAHRNAHRRSEFTVQLEKAHEEIHAAFLQAMVETRCSQMRAARSMDVSIDTIRNWVHRRTNVSVAHVWACRILKKAFRRQMCTFDHSQGSAPYILKKSPGSR